MEARDIEIRMHRNDDHIPFGILFRESIKLTVRGEDSSEGHYQALYKSRQSFRELYIIMSTKGNKRTMNPKRRSIIDDYISHLYGHTNRRLLKTFLDAYNNPSNYPRMWDNYD